MKSYLILVKHSLPEIVEGLPAREWKLSEEGERRAEQLAHCLIQFQSETIVSSDEPKAIETAEIIGRVLSLKVKIVKGMHEQQRDNVAYLSPDLFEASVREFFKKPDQIIFGSESADQAHARFSQAVFSVLKSNVDKTVAIVAHGTVISLFVSRLVQISDFIL